MGPRVKLRTTDCPRPVLTLEEFSTGARQQRTTRPLVVSHGQLGVEGKKCLNLPGAEVEGRRRWGRVRTGAGGASRCRRGWTLGAAPGTPSSQRTGRGQGGAVCCPHLPPRPPRGDPHGCRGRSSVSSRVPREGGDCGPILPPPPIPSPPCQDSRSTRLWKQSPRVLQVCAPSSLLQFAFGKTMRVCI